MNKMIIMVGLLLGSQFAFAHPKDTDSVYFVGVGTKLVATTDFNLPGNSWFTRDSSDGYCYLAYPTSPKDRVIRAFASLEISSVKYVSSGTNPHNRLYLAKPLNAYVYCKLGATIQHLRNSFPTFNIEFPTPDDF